MRAVVEASAAMTATATAAVTPTEVHELATTLFGEDLHAKRVLSLSLVTLGVLRAGSLAIHAIGQGLALARNTDKKHGVKQVDRFLSNAGIDPWELFSAWVPFLVAQRSELVVALDWTDFDGDGQSTIALNLVTDHGRTTPLVWKTVEKKQLSKRRNEFEDEVLQRLKETLPSTVTKVTVLADRGFGDQKLYEALKEEWGFDYVIRFRGVVMVEDEHGEVKSAKDWLPVTGRARLLRNVCVTNQRQPVPSVVAVKAKGMKEAWFLASSSSTLSAAEITKLYGLRFRIEETFRDLKDLRFGMGLSSTHVSTPARRDRLFLVSALALVLLTLLGAAGEAVGIDRFFKVNTSKKRQYSLFRQGCDYYEFLPGMKEERATALINKFVELLAQHAVFNAVFGPI